MTNQRLELQRELERILNSKQVYFQPPPGVVMKYPAIRYRLSDIFDIRADNKIYYGKDMYELILITVDPDIEIVHELMKFPMCRFVRSYVADNLYHFVYNIYF